MLGFDPVGQARQQAQARSGGAVFRCANKNSAAVHLVARVRATQFMINKAAFVRRRNGAPELSPESYTLPCTRETSITSGSSSPAYKALHRASGGGLPDGPRSLPRTFIGDAEIVFNRTRQESQMNISLTAVVLCLAMQTAAAAQCVTPPAAISRQARASTASTDLVKKTSTVVTAPPLAPPPSGGELIKTASAGTHDEVPGLTPRRTPAAVASTQDDDQRHRGGPAMLLAAVALMSGIALRRFGANK
jgi:hypothetical protein